MRACLPAGVTYHEVPDLLSSGSPVFHCQGQNLSQFPSGWKGSQGARVLAIGLRRPLGGDSIALLVLSLLSMSSGSHFLMPLSLYQFLLQRKEQKAT